MLPPALLQFLTLVFGYLYPAYLCFKAIRKRRPDVKELLWFCQFWVLIALITVTERLADPFLERLPMYAEAKLALVIYLWYPDNKGTDHVYNNLLQPVLLQNEEDIDKHVDEIKGRVNDAVSQVQTAVSAYMQAVVDETIANLTAVSAQAAAAAAAQQQRQQARQQQQWQQLVS
ncbi:hypothetical protein CLOM_g10453 [Closterium sp. NIES-68]|nr:hypothetical protein CLOM_g10453 [Closterium sp. NIES-68]GJP74035.1 hypothetical protein CLOP_g4685 [Closterium sp. NIES-67]